jgi:ABC-type dipeptide/oligopeptide/nickel transport system ATPase component
LRLIPSPEEIIGGEILFAGEDPLKKSEKAIEKIRGREISMVFQEPMTSFNPSYTIGEQISECLRVHLGHTRKVAWDWAEHILVAVRMPAPRAATTRYPHELSGRMR